MRGLTHDDVFLLNECCIVCDGVSSDGAIFDDSFQKAFSRLEKEGRVVRYPCNFCHSYHGSTTSAGLEALRIHDSLRTIANLSI